MQILSILKINFLDDHKMQIFLNNQNCILYDMTPKLKTTRFIELNDLNFFKCGTLSGNRIIRWSPCIEITLDEIMLQNIKNDRKDVPHTFYRSE